MMPNSMIQVLGFAESDILILWILTWKCDFDVVMPQIEAMAEDIQPLLSELRDSGLLREFESLTKSLAETTEDMR